MTRLIYQRPEDAHPFELPSAKDLPLERAKQVMTMRALKERLVYRGYVRRGTLYQWSEAFRTPAGQEFARWVLFAYALMWANRFW